MKNALIILLFIVYYISGNVMNILPFSVSVIYYGLFFYCLVLILVGKRNWWKIEKETIWVIVGCLVLFVSRYFSGILRGSVQAMLRLILPALLISVFPKEMDKQSTISVKSHVKGFVDCFFIIECSVAILEFVFHHHIFGFVENTYAGGLVDYQGADFRSVAFLCSPLGNALEVTTMMTFYLFDANTTVKKKLVFWGLGLVAVFCFNARSAIVINLLGMVFFVLKKMWQGNLRTKIRYFSLAGLVCVAVLALYILGLGSRLFGTESIEDDGSIAVRLKLFDYLMGLDFRSYLFGHSDAFIESEMTYIGVEIIENFWVIYIFLLGIIATIYFAFLYFRIGGKLLSTYPVYDKIVISFLFIVLASINNSLYSGYLPLFTFLLCCYTFTPLHNNNIIPYK